jgi:glycosyltransferase involved in cell wall biosynthesis
MKYGKPAIVRNVDGPREIVRDEIDALMFSDPNQIPDLVMKLVQNEKLLNQLVENSFERVKEKFTFKNLEKRLFEIVGKINN